MKALSDIEALGPVKLERLRITPCTGGYQVVIELAKEGWIVGVGTTIIAALEDAATKLHLHLNPLRSLFD